MQKASNYGRATQTFDKTDKNLNALNQLNRSCLDKLNKITAVNISTPPFDELDAIQDEKLETIESFEKSE